MEIDTSDHARSLRSIEVIKLRQSMLRQPHIAVLTDYVSRLKAANPTWEYPYFDPLDGGIRADILFLLEKPGPKTSTNGKGSGFISRNNDDPTAAAVFAFMQEVGLSRERTIIWNVIPGWNNTRNTHAEELRQGLAELKNLLPLLPNLRTVVLVGKKAQKAKPYITSMGFRILESAHPSTLVRNSQPDLWHAIPSIWRKARLIT